MSSIEEHIIEKLYLYIKKLKENFLMKSKERENIKGKRKRNRIEIRDFLVKKLSDFACSFKEGLDNEINVKSISPEEEKKLSLR